MIGGDEVRGAERFDVVYPYTGEVVGSAPSLEAEQIRRALTLAGSARVALDRYGRTRVLERVAESVDAAGDALAAAITRESGLSLKDTRHEIARASDVFRSAARAALRDDGEAFAADVSPNGRARRAFTVREPVRLVAAITPFNHPLNQVAHKLAPAIAAGAPIVLKPSEKTPLAALWLARAILDAGYAADALAVVTGEPRVVVGEMLAHEAVEVVAFTGSVEVGRWLAANAGYRRTVLELGGNDPLIVLADADLDEAAALAVRGATQNSGQRCTAVKRVLVEATVADELAARVAARAGTLVVGDPLDERTDVGTLIDEEAALRVERRVVAALAEGAQLLGGGEREGPQIVPPVLDRVAPTSELVREETFGPAIPLVRVASLDEAISVANDTEYGLSAGVVTNDLAAVTRCVAELRCGTVNVREVPGFRSEEAPFGGVKASGLGVKEGVVESMRAMTNVKLVSLPWGSIAS
ncbi:MAG: aldehyde dehydrogenase family protein [Actinobacteria bacterium]|nr:aldehyde dehydrogenase family protein [Actinomycetota bacterium]MBV8396151.1 aldehyde dehydrogenase family protein [Actinomycetota bacterium]